MDEDPIPFCGRCGASRQINWSPSFGRYLCPTCRWSLTDIELRQPVTILAPEVT